MTRARTRKSNSGGRGDIRGRGRAVGYLRRSTDRQEQSIPDQKRDVERYIKEQGLRLVKHYIDDAISGTSTAGRRGFQQMIEDAQRPHCPFDTIVVYDVKRFGRVDNDEAGYYRHVLKTHGVEVLYVSENFNGDATDDLLRPVKQWQARQESKDLSKVTIRGLMSKAESGDGTWMGGCPPYGYDLKYENASGDFLFIIRYLPDRTKQQLDQKGCVTRTLERGESLSISKQDKARLVPSSKDRVDVINRIFKGYAHEGKGYKKRRSIMQAVRRSGTEPEERLHVLLRSTGIKYERNVRSLPGKPDFLFPPIRLIVFVHGCFWHGHTRCRKGRSLPKSNRRYWKNKIARNIRRDKRVAKQLRRAGYSVFTIWACELKRSTSLPDRLVRKFGKAS